MWLSTASGARFGPGRPLEALGMATVHPELEPLAGVAPRTLTNPVISGVYGRDHGDPFVLRHLDEYFLYHTTDDGDSGISVHRSRDLTHWHYAGCALAPQGPVSWIQTDLWAPEVMYWRGRFHMYFAATLVGADGHGDPAFRRIGVASSDHPLGPFVPEREPLVRHEYAIDPHPFQDEDGSLWLFYNVRRDELACDGRPSSANVVDRLITPTQLAGEVTPVSIPSAAWESSHDGLEYWNEGSYVLKRRGRYHELYSGSHYRADSYAIGLSSSDSLRGPWAKPSEAPLFSSGVRITGPGHHSVILAPDGVTPYAVYHGYDSGEPGRKVCVDPLRWCGDRPVIGTGATPGHPTEAAQPIPPGPVHDAGVPWWHADLWVDGTELRVGAVTVELEAHPGAKRVRVNQGFRGLRVWVDDRLVAEADGLHRPEFDPDGEIVAASLTSHFDDEVVHRLAPGERRRWQWGGSGALEISVAVRGSATVAAGQASIAVSGEDDYALGHLRADAGGAREIVVEAGPAGAEVTDLAVTAR